jgi:uncharacterized protein
VCQSLSNVSHCGIGIHDKVAALSSPGLYPDDPARVEVVETHKSWVFLTDTRAYKLKAPIRYNAVDLHRLTRRHKNCLEEVRLNRRLAPDVYLGIASLTADERGTLTLDGRGRVVDWLVVMRRLPADRMLDDLIQRDRLREHDVRAVATVLSGFYQRCQPIDISPPQYRRRLREDILVNRKEIANAEYRLPQETIELVHDVQLTMLETESELFDARVHEGRIVEGHGDLRASHVCLEDPPVIFDCLEFDRDLRIVDAADEQAFLALECERIGAAFVGPLLFDVYEQETSDHPTPRLLDFYKSYRACVWARLALWRTHDIEKDKWGKWLSRANEYLQLAEKYSRSLERRIPKADDARDPPD